LTQWDIKPPGYENVTAEQAKLSGMFPLPGAPRTQPMDPSKLQAFMSQPSGSVTNAALKPSNSRQSKRLVVSKLPMGISEETIIGFFNLQLNGLNVVEGSDPCISAQMSKDKSFALLEFKNPSDATVALALDGISMEDNDNMVSGNGSSNGASKGLSISRPKDYIVPVSEETPYEAGVISNVVVDTPNKISISNIPLYLTDEQVSELLVSFGELKAFVLVKDNSTEESRVSITISLCRDSSTDFLLGNRFLRIRRPRASDRYCRRRSQWYGAWR
jgi:splicing factor U2AF subunit